MSLSPSEAALIGACAHGHAAKIDQTGFNPAWLPSNHVREILGSIFTLSRQGKAVNILNVMTLSKGVAKEEWPAVHRIWSNGYGDVDPLEAVRSAKHDYMVSEAKRSAQEICELADTQPQNVEKWIASHTSRLVSLIRNSETYDARPSSHLEKKIPTVTFQSLIPVRNDIYRGGYRNGAYFLWAGLKNGGKTTESISTAVDVLMQGRKVKYVNTENSETVATANILLGLSGLTEKEIQSKSFESSEREDAYRKWCAFLDEHLEVYNYTWLNDARLKRLSAWNPPDVIIIDYLKAMPDMFVSGNHLDPVGDISDFIANELCASMGMCVVASGQIADEARKRIIAKDEPTDPIILYGSSRAVFPAYVYGIVKRHTTRRNIARFFVWYDKLTGRFNTPHDVEYNPLRKIWMFPRHALHDGEYLT